jgi:hypothetical protein
MRPNARPSMGLDEYLTHRTRDGYGDIAYGDKWRKRMPPIMNVVLHMHGQIAALWRHNWPRLFERTDRDTGEKTVVVWGGNWTCWSPENELRSQSSRDANGDMEVPFTICPFCRFTDALYHAVYTSKTIDWLAPVFKFEGDVPADTRVLHAAPMINHVPREPSENEKLELRSAGLRRTELWRENVLSKCNYVFEYLDYDKPEDGMRVTTEAQLLGDKVRSALIKRINDLGKEKGDPRKVPFVIQFEHRPKEKAFSDKYDATVMTSKEIAASIFDIVSDPKTRPDTSRVIARQNATLLRSIMEARCLIPGVFDWDAIFGPAERVGGGEMSDGVDDEEETTPGTPLSAPLPRPAPEVGRHLGPAPKPAPEAVQAASASTGPGRRRVEVPKEPLPPARTIPCDKCGNQMGEMEAVCSRCGTRYEFDDPPAVAPVAPAPAVAAPPAPAPAASPKAVVPDSPPAAKAAAPLPKGRKSKAAGGIGEGFPANPDDDIPF